MEKNIYQKLLESQKEIGVIKKDSDNPFFKSKYFDINAILAVVKPVLNKHGLVLTQALETRDGKTGIITSIFNPDVTTPVKLEGIENPVYMENISSFVEIPTMAKPQETGSAITYFRRYALQSLLALEAEDDDGNVASGNGAKKVGYVKAKGGKMVVDPTTITEETDPFID